MTFYLFNTGEFEFSRVKRLKGLPAATSTAPPTPVPPSAAASTPSSVSPATAPAIPTISKSPVERVAPSEPVPVGLVDVLLGGLVVAFFRAHLFRLGNVHMSGHEDDGDEEEQGSDKLVHGLFRLLSFLVGLIVAA